MSRCPRAAGVLAALFAAAPAPFVSAASPEPCRGEAYDLARRFVGTWEEYSVAEARETLEGVLTTTLEANGCALTQSFVSRDRSLSFRTLGYVEPDTGRWFETYVLSNGRVANYRWRTEGAQIMFDRLSGEATRRLRYRVTFVSKDAYEVILEHAPADSDQWTVQTKTLARRIAT